MEPQDGGLTVSPLGGEPGRSLAIPRAHAAFPGLDGLRAIAAIGVVLCHIPGVWPGRPSWSPYLVELRSGVEIFFVLSGFLLYRPFALAQLRGVPFPSIRDYFVRRAFRIYPAYWVALLGSVYLLGVGALSTPRVASLHLALVHTYDPGYAISQGLPIAWTLVVEVSFYCVLPLLAWGTRRASGGRPVGQGACIAVLVAVGVASAAWVAFGSPPTFVLVLPANLAPLALGMLLAVVSASIETSGREPTWVKRFGRWPAAWWLLAAFAWSATVWLVDIPAVLPFGGHLTGKQRFAESLLFTVVGIAMVLPAVLGDQERGLIRRGLRLRPIVFLGIVSYGIYLWHYAVLVRIDDWLGADLHGWAFLVVVFSATLAVTVPLAAVSWFVIERPTMQFARRSLTRLEHPPDQG